MVLSLLLDLFYALLLLAAAPWILYRLIRQGRYRTGWRERLGGAPIRHSSQPCLWLHAVSVGEVNAAVALIAQLEAALPHFEIVISSTTDTGLARARQLYGRTHRVFYFPLDFSWAVRRAFDRLRPQLCVLLELEVWHNFTALARRRGVPVVVVNGRISTAKGFPRYRRFAPLVRPMFRRLALVLAQDETYAQRFRLLGVPPDRIQVPGSLKYDTAELADQIAGSDELARQLALAPPDCLWVAGSTGPGEEDVLLTAWHTLRTRPGLETLRLALVPRKPERFDEVARLIESRGHRLVRYSTLKAAPAGLSDADHQAVILGDTLGDLRKFYSLARLVFVGRSLVPLGGSDMIEAAALAKPVLVGPHTQNFAETVQALLAGGGIEVVSNARQLLDRTEYLLRNPAAARQLGQNARLVIAQRQGATARCVQAITRLLGYQPPLGPHAIATPALLT